MKYGNKEKTIISNGIACGPVETMLQQGRITEEDLQNAEPWRTLEEWKDVLFANSKSYRRELECTPILHLGYHITCREKDANAIDILDRKAEKEGYNPLWPMYYQVSPTEAIELKIEADYLELQRVIHDRWQKLFNAMGQCNLMIETLTTIEECEGFDVRAIMDGLI
jgi:hypothetical protein